MIIFDSKKFQHKLSIKNNSSKKFIKLIGILAFGIFPSILLQKKTLTDTISNQINNEKEIKNYQYKYEPKWKKQNPNGYKI